ncbi:MAG: Gfo/Idh/MocA family oxidoreductase, partial [Verrucomicrobiota bacterium]
MKKDLSRRNFIKASAAATMAFHILPDSARGANSQVRVGCIGIGGKGSVDSRETHAAGGKIVAVCDIIDPRVSGRGKLIKNGGKIFEKAPDATFYADYRELLEKEDIDAVTVSTPDHHHFHASMMAIRKGKHVFCQKPLTHSIWEARQLTLAAKKHGVQTQMGNQAHAGEPIRRAVEIIRSGILGKIKEVHAWTNRPIWPQGMTKRPKAEPVPDGLDWEQWIGPAPFSDYSSAYTPFKWRGWWDFGTGALGDMACHIMDMPYWALELGHATAVECRQEGNTDLAGPNHSQITYTVRGPGRVRAGGPAGPPPRWRPLG